MAGVRAVASRWKTICAKCREMFLFYKLQGTEISRHLRLRGPIVATKFVFVVKGRDAMLKIYHNDGMCVVF